MSTDALVIQLFDAQDDLQRKSYAAGSPIDLEGDELIEFIRWNVLALTDELHEMLNEVGWKPWATSRHVNAEAATRELVDALHFFMNLVMAVSPDRGDLEGAVERLVNGYFEKRNVNAQRQRDGYDGVAGKCPTCHRDRSEAIDIPTASSPYSDAMCPCGYVWHAEVKH